MKQEIRFYIKSENTGTIETLETYQNMFFEQLEVHNFYISSVFKDVKLYDDKNRALSFEMIPINNRRDNYYAIYLKEPVASGSSFVSKLNANIDEKYFDLTTIKKDNLYFWNLNYMPGKKTEVLYAIYFSGEFELVHVQGIQPTVNKAKEVIWQLNMTEEQTFNPLVIYKKIEK